MKKYNKIAVIGGAGKSGRYLVNELLNQGFNIRLLLRHPEKLQLQNPLIEPVKGDARDYKAIKDLLDGCDAVLSTLGQPKGEPSIFSAATNNVLRAMGELNINRYILTTGLNVDTPTDKKGPKTKFATDWMKTNYPETTFDKQTEYEVLTGSTINWTLIRLPLIELSEKQGKVLCSLEDCLGEKIRAADLARFLIEQLSDTSFNRRAPFISNES